MAKVPARLKLTMSRMCMEHRIASAEDVATSALEVATDALEA